MKKAIVGFIAGAILATASTAAATSWWGGAGILCARRGSVIGCMKQDGTGYQMGISNSQVMITNNGGSHVVWHRYQP